MSPVLSKHALHKLLTFYLIKNYISPFVLREFY